MRAGDKQVVGWTVEKVRNCAGNGEKRRDPVGSEHGDKDTKGAIRSPSSVLLEKRACLRLPVGFKKTLRKGYLGTDWTPLKGHQLQGKERWL